MSLTDMNNGSGFYMPVAPAYNYGNNGGGFFGNDFAWIILLLLIGGGGWGFGGGFGMGGMMPWMMGMNMGGFGLDYLYPWLSQSREINGGFRDQQIQTGIEGVRDAVTTGFSAVQLGQAGISKEICATGRDITGAVRDGFSAAEIAANGRQMANMQTQFGIQSAIQGGAATTAAGIADLKYTVAQEGCNDRAALAQGLQTQTMQEISNTNALMTAIRDGIQSIKDELCADRIEGYKRQVADRDREIDTLNSRLNYANEQAARVAQTSQIVDNIYSRLATCPVNTVSVYGNQPVFRCAGPVTGNSCVCSGNNGFGFAAA